MNILLIINKNNNNLNITVFPQLNKIKQNKFVIKIFN